MVLIWPGAVLMSVANITTEGLADACRCLWAILIWPYPSSAATCGASCGMESSGHLTEAQSVAWNPGELVLPLDDIAWVQVRAGPALYQPLHGSPQ